jgi:deoxyhypusine synthase
MTKKSEFLKHPIRPFIPRSGLSAPEILSQMENISFQGRNLGLAHRVWKRMIGDDVLIFLGVAGALSAGGLRMIIADLITRRAVDCLVSTGANLYHDLHETLGNHHFIGSHRIDDGALQEHHIDRVYDTYMDEDEFIENDKWIAKFTATLESRPYSTREYLHKLGGHLWEASHADGILTAAFRSGVPIFCPGIADSSLGMGLSQARMIDRNKGQIDVIEDVSESANIVIRHPRTASIVLGGGTPKNFINQASVQAAFYCPDIPGHQFAIQIITDVPHFGGASGSSLDEAKSWGKLASDADHVTVHADATLALPLLVSGIASSAQDELDKRTPPTFGLGSRALVVDGITIPISEYDTSATD